MPRSILAACCLALLASGCGPSNGSVTKESSDEATLTQVGELCRLYQSAKNKPPAKLTDFGAEKSIAPHGFEALKSGKVVLLGATLPDLGEDPGQGGGDDEVLAYYADVPESGGKVLMLNRTIKTMTADEFKAAKKAGKELPLPPAGKKK